MQYLHLRLLVEVHRILGEALLDSLSDAIVVRRLGLTGDEYDEIFMAANFAYQIAIVHVLDAKPNELLHAVLDDVVLHPEWHFGGLQHELAIIPFIRSRPCKVSCFVELCFPMKPLHNHRPPWTKVTVVVVVRNGVGHGFTRPTPQSVVVRLHRPPKASWFILTLKTTDGKILLQESYSNYLHVLMDACLDG